MNRENGKVGEMSEGRWDKETDEGGDTGKAGNVSTYGLWARSGPELPSVRPLIIFFKAPVKAWAM